MDFLKIELDSSFMQTWLPQEKLNKAKFVIAKALQNLILLYYKLKF